MRKIYLLAAIAVPALFTACSNEDMNLTSTQEVEGLVKVADLDLTVGFADQAESRADYQLNEAGTAYSFFWNGAADQIGMSLVNEGTTPLTNYAFKVDSLKLADFKVKTAGQARWTGYYHVSESDLTAVYTKEDGGAISSTDLGQSQYAKFGTTNETILGGKYIVYYPYSKTFTDPSNGNIPVSMSVAQYQSVAVGENMKYAAAQTFAYSPEKWTVAGGVKCEAFELVPATGVLQIMVGNADASAHNIAKVVLKAKDESKFYTKAELNGIPAKTAAASTLFTNHDAVTSTDILTVDVVSTYAATPTASSQTVAVGADVDDATPINIAIFPGTYNFDIILVNEDGYGYTFELEEAVTVNNKAKRVKVTIPEEAEFNELIVTSHADLVEALEETTGATTIKVLKPVTTTAGIAIESDNTNAVTFEGEAVTFSNTFTANGNVIFNNNVTFKNIITTSSDLTFNAETSLESATAYTAITGNIEVGAEGTLTLKKDLTMSASKKLEVEGTLNVNAGTLTLPASSNLYVEGAVVVAANAKVSNSGKVQVLGTFTNNGEYYKASADATYEGVTLVNNGDYAVSAVTLEDIKMANADANVTKINVDANILNALDADLTIGKNVEVCSSAIIQTATYTNPTVAQAANLKKLTVNDLVISNGATIATNVDVLGDLTIKAGTLTIQNGITVAVTGDLVNNGTFSIAVDADGTGAASVKGIVTCAAFNGTGTWTSLPTVE